MRYDYLRVFLLIVASSDLELVQFDVKTAFLNRDLEEKIYMKLPEGLSVDKSDRSVVCKLRKSLYGLKQAFGCWNEKLTSFLSTFNLNECESIRCVFSGKVDGCEVYPGLFVDDSLIASESQSIVKRLIAYSVNLVSRYLSDYDERHWQAVKRIFST